MRFLDNVLTDFIDNAPEEFSDATYSAIRERSVGLELWVFILIFKKRWFH